MTKKALLKNNLEQVFVNSRGEVSLPQLIYATLSFSIFANAVSSFCIIAKRYFAHQ
jgi:hypothetical protein